MKRKLLVLLLLIPVCHLSAQVKKPLLVAGVPVQVQQWIDKELVRAKKKSLLDLKSSDFFTRDTAKIIGYIRGYDRRLGFSTGIIYLRNDLTNENSPVIVEILEDGRFQASIPLSYPRYTSVLFKNQPVNFYIEPGQTLSFIINWNEYSTVRPDGGSLPKKLKFSGPLARINEELNSFVPEEISSRALLDSINKQSPEEFKKSVMAMWSNGSIKLEEFIKGKNFTSQSQTILRNEISINHAYLLFNYLFGKDYGNVKEIQGPAKDKSAVYPSYFGFMQDLPLDDQRALITQRISFFINRFEFNDPFKKALANPGGRRPFHDYLFSDLGLIPTDEDKLYLNSIKRISKSTPAAAVNDRDSLIKELLMRSASFFKTYNSYYKQYDQKYPQKAEGIGGFHLANWEAKDSVLTSYFKLQPNLIYEISKVRSLNEIFRSMNGRKDDARTFLTALEQGITNPFLLEESERMFNTAFPAVQSTGYDLPAGTGADIFKTIIAQHKGKMLIVDFWATTCAPCIASIKQHKVTRTGYKDHKDIDFLFITSENESPSKRYNEFILEQSLTNTYRLPPDDFRYLRELFKFNGIPRYVLISKEGRVLNNDFPMYRLERELASLTAGLIK